MLCMNVCSMENSQEEWQVDAQLQSYDLIGISAGSIDYIISVLLWTDTHYLGRIRKVKTRCALSSEEPGTVFQNR